MAQHLRKGREARERRQQRAALRRVLRAIAVVGYLQAGETLAKGGACSI